MEKELCIGRCGDVENLATNNGGTSFHDIDVLL